MARGIAALLIVCYHASAIVGMPRHHGVHPFGGVAQFGWFGVDFFFVLSGFIVFYVHAADLGHPGRWTRYLMKRVVRIYPPYWVVTLLVLPVYWAIPGFGAGTELEPSRLLSSVLLTPHREAPVVVVAWSLRHEMLFYLVFGLAVLHRRIGGGVFLGWQVAVLVAAFMAVPTSPWLRLVLDLRNFDFLLGVLGAHLVLRGNARGFPVGRREALLGAGGLAIMGAALPLSHWGSGWPFAIVGVGVGSLLVIVCLARVDTASSGRWGGALRVLGEASYSVYLTHYLVLSAAGKVIWAVGLGARLAPEVAFALLVAIAVGAGVLFRRIVEVPLLDVLGGWIPPSKRGPKGSES